MPHVFFPTSRAPRTGVANSLSAGSLAVAIAASVMLAVTSPLSAQGTSRVAPVAGVKLPRTAATDPALGARTLRAARLSGAIRIDGSLDDAAWATADVGKDFRQSWPNDKAPASEPTEVRVLYDDEALYVGVRLFDAHPDSIASQLARRDATGIYSDWVHVVVDSYHDRRTAFRFSVNPRGVQKDVRHFDDTNEDLLWDAVWEVATRVDSLGWTAEYRIPLSQLRFSDCTRSCVWGLNVQRDEARNGERSGWSYVSRDANSYVARMGELTGLEGIKRPGRLELLPYVSSTLTRDTAQAGNPFFRANDGAYSVGADFKYGVTSGLTLTGTVNPDFGQVELDPAVVNLSQFESFFDEKRPFFVEGSDLFRFGGTRAYNNFGGGNFFYSRRIGRPPQRGVNAGDVSDAGVPAGSTVLARDVLYADPPATSTILGAAKLSGKTAGGWSIAALDAVTARETARFEQSVESVDPATGDTTTALSRGRAPVEPLTNYSVARVRRDLNGGRSVVGALLTGVTRDLSDAVFRPMLRSNAVTGGVDFDHTWGNRIWSLSGFLAGSRVAGDSTAILRAQRSFVRYYQRPDADYLGVNPSRTSLAGYAGALALTKTGGEHWTGSLSYQETSPGFELNDIGFQQSADRRALSTFVGYHENTPGKHLRSWEARAYSNHAMNFGGDNVFQAVVAAGDAQLTNFWTVNLRARFDPQYLSDRGTRGGPLMGNPLGWSTDGGISTDSRRPIVVTLGGFYRTDTSRAFDRNVGLTVDTRPTSSVRVTFEPSLANSYSTGQWITALSGGPAATYGLREVFSDVKTTELAFPLRANWTFTPTLSLEAVAKPLVSANRFYHFKQLHAARSYTFDRFGAGGVGTISGSAATGYSVDPDPNATGDEFTIPPLDFTQRSLRGNAVLRWEYRPGSALFFVWQQTRDGVLGDGDFATSRDIRGVFREKERNVFVVKGTWWVAR